MEPDDLLVTKLVCLAVSAIVNAGTGKSAAEVCAGADEFEAHVTAAIAATS